jgi:ATP-dependent RNA helicase RhlE
MPMERRTERLLGCARDGLNQPAAVADRRVATRKKLPLAAFADLGLIEPILSSIRAEKYTAPTPIQVQAIPALLEGRDLLGCAQTGTGKTAAFALPILQRLSAGGRRAPPWCCRALVLSPTRELAAQIVDSFAAYGRNLKLTRAAVFGGVCQTPQVRALTPGVDILVATPGRLLDLMGQRFVRLDRLEVFVLDEADRMLDLGFINDVREVIRALPNKRQTMMFSATMPTQIARLADGILSQPVKVAVHPVASTVDRIEQRVMFVERADKRLLLSKVLKDPTLERVLIFTRTKHGANRVADTLTRSGRHADAIHGNKSQAARTRALDRFRSGAGRILVATDIAARGIDVLGITHVINYDLPNVPESYVHRIGRTARAGRSGVAISFCDSEERAYLREIEALIRFRIPVIAYHPWHSAPMPLHTGTAAPQ